MPVVLLSVFMRIEIYCYPTAFKLVKVCFYEIKHGNHIWQPAIRRWTKQNIYEYWIFPQKSRCLRIGCIYNLQGNSSVFCIMNKTYDSKDRTETTLHWKNYLQKYNNLRVAFSWHVYNNWIQVMCYIWLIIFNVIHYSYINWLIVV